MTGLKQRILRRRAPGSPRRSAAGFVPRLKAGLSRLRPSGPPKLRRGGRSRLPWGKRAAQQRLLAPGGGPAAGAPATGVPAGGAAAGGVPAGSPGDADAEATGASAATVETTELLDVAPGSASFRDRGRLRRRLRFLRRARELAFRDVGGLIFDLRRFSRDRPDLVEAKLAALGAVDRELRALERVLDDRRPIHELREPGLSSCQRCGALHASEDNFCPRCGLQFGGAQAMGEVGGAIAAPPQPPPVPIEQPTAATLIVPGSGLEQAGSQAGHAVPVERPGLFSSAAGGRLATPAVGPKPSADGAQGQPARPVGGPGPGPPADGAQGHPATPAGEPRPSAGSAQGHPSTDADGPASSADGAKRGRTVRAPDDPAGDEQQTEIFRPRDAS
jgi:hypothetical protein